MGPERRNNGAESCPKRPQTRRARDAMLVASLAGATTDAAVLDRILSTNFQHLEAFQLGKGERAALDVHAAVFRAARQRRDDLARIEQALRIERRLQRQHLRALGLRE